LLQAGLDVIIFCCCSVSASVPAGQASLNFSLLSYTFISFPDSYRDISGWGAVTAMNPKAIGSLTAAIPNR